MRISRLAVSFMWISPVIGILHSDIEVVVGRCGSKQRLLSEGISRKPGVAAAKVFPGVPYQILLCCLLPELMFLPCRGLLSL